MRPRVLLLLLLAASVPGCARRGRGDSSAGVIDAVRASYGSQVRAQLPMVPARLSQVPPCPWDADGAPDAGYLLVIEDRRIGTSDAIVVARTVCRRLRPGANGLLASLLERFTLERRMGAWRVRLREMLEDRIQ